MVLLAVSGGIDSVYLTRKAFLDGTPFAIAHCNFQLRGAESDSDESFVRALAAELGVECFVERFDTTSYAASHGISIEMAARHLRYAWFGQLCSTRGFECVCVAHNASDNAETLLLNLLRGCGGKGFCGMSSSSVRPVELPNGTTYNLRIERPLLGTPRSEIEVWMKKGGYTWREDSSNASDAYKRNILRHNVLPVFGQINPSYLQTLSEDMARASQIQAIAADYAQEADIFEKPGWISLAKLLSYKHWRYILWSAIEQYGLTQEAFDNLCALVEKHDIPGITFSGKQFIGRHGTVRTRSNSRTKKKFLCISSTATI